MDILVYPDGRLEWRGTVVRCALGKSGIAVTKREGDGATPLGCFALRRVLYRPDRVEAPRTGLPCEAIRPDDGWCDDPADPAYNQPIRLPHGAHHEEMWRDDGVYDLVVVLGHNDDPIEAGAGSAVFLHLAKPDYGATEGCVALAADDLVTLLRDCRPGDRLCVMAR